ncbi:MAG: hypothetical protein V4560_19300 [Bacteroidota bacterium]
MANKKAYRSIADRKYISLSKLLTAVVTLVLMVGVIGTCSAQTKKAAAAQTKNTTVKDDHNTPMPDNNAMVIPVDKLTTTENTTESSTGSYMDKAISNYVYQQKAKKASVADSATIKKTNAVAVKVISPADKKSVESTPDQ